MRALPGLRALGVAALVLSLVACGSGQPRTSDLEAARVEANIPDCPSVDAVSPSPKLPDVALECLGGRKKLNPAHLRGQPTLLLAFAQWCEPCRKELPLLAPALDGTRVRVLLVATQETRYADAIELLALTGARFPVVIDEDRRLGQSVGVAGIPYSIMIDANGHVAHVRAGGWPDAATLQRALTDNLGVK